MDGDDGDDVDGDGDDDDEDDVDENQRALRESCLANWMCALSPAVDEQIIVHDEIIDNDNTEHIQLQEQFLLRAVRHKNLCAMDPGPGGAELPADRWAAALRQSPLPG